MHPTILLYHPQCHSHPGMELLPRSIGVPHGAQLTRAGLGQHEALDDGLDALPGAVGQEDKLPGPRAGGHEADLGRVVCVSSLPRGWMCWLGGGSLQGGCLRWGWRRREIGGR